MGAQRRAYSCVRLERLHLQRTCHFSRAGKEERLRSIDCRNQCAGMKVPPASIKVAGSAHVVSGNFRRIAAEYVDQSNGGNALMSGRRAAVRTPGGPISSAAPLVDRAEPIIRMIDVPIVNVVRVFLCLRAL